MATGDLANPMSVWNACFESVCLVLYMHIISSSLCVCEMQKKHFIMRCLVFYVLKELLALSLIHLLPIFLSHSVTDYRSIPFSHLLSPFYIPSLAFCLLSLFLPPSLSLSVTSHAWSLWKHWLFWLWLLLLLHSQYGWAWIFYPGGEKERGIESSGGGTGERERSDRAE